MTSARKGTLALVALVPALMLPLGAVAQEDDTTTTTVEIEISATSITSTTEEADPDSGGSNGPDDTLPFTGSSPRGTATVAYFALGVGVWLLAITRRERAEGANSD